MAGEVGSVVFRVGGDVSVLENALSSGARSVRDFSRVSVSALREATDSIAKLGAAAGVTAAGGLLALTKSAAATSKEIINLSNVSNASAEEFQKYAFAAKSLGVEQEKLADIFKDVNDKVGDFLTTGGGPLVDFFEQIAPRVGVTADAFRNLSGPQALELFFSSLEKANLSQAEMTFHLEAMASDLTLLQPLLQNNASLLREQSAEAEKFGLILSDFDLAQLKETEEAFAVMAAQAEAAKNVIAAEFAPILNELLARFGELTESGFDLGEKVSEAFEKSAKAVAFVGDAIHGVRVVFKGVEVAAVGFGAAVTTAFAATSNVVAGFLDDIIVNVNNVISAMNNLPGVDLSEFPLLSDSGFVQSVNEASNTMINNVRELRTELHDMAMQELPSANLESFLDAAKERAIQTREEVAALNSSISSLAGEEDSEELAKFEEKNQKMQELQAWHAQRMLELKQVEFDGIQKLTEKHISTEAAQTVGAAKHLLGTMAQTSEKAFKISKAFALADALVSTYQGIAKGVSMGWPAGIPAVAWATATGFAQVQAIRSQSFSGGGSGSTGTAAAPAPAASSAPIQASGGGAVGAGQTLILQPVDPNSIFSGSQINELAMQLQEFTADGGTVVANQ